MTTKKDYVDENRHRDNEDDSEQSWRSIDGVDHRRRKSLKPDSRTTVAAAHFSERVVVEACFATYKEPMARVLGAAVFFCLFTISGCPELGPRSLPFQPPPGNCQSYFESARQDVFPNDIRALAPGSPHPELVAWVGVIEGSQTTVDDDGAGWIRVRLHHHYFDWIDDRGLREARFFVSPRGEGDFELFALAGSYQNRRQRLEPGDMVVVVGYPSKTSWDAVPVLDYCCAFALPEGVFSTDIGTTDARICSRAMNPTRKSCAGSNAPARRQSHQRAVIDTSEKTALRLEQAGLLDSRPPSSPRAILG